MNIAREISTLDVINIFFNRPSRASLSSVVPRRRRVNRMIVRDTVGGYRDARACTQDLCLHSSIMTRMLPHELTPIASLYTSSTSRSLVDLLLPPHASSQYFRHGKIWKERVIVGRKFFYLSQFSYQIKKIYRGIRLTSIAFHGFNVEACLWKCGINEVILARPYTPASTLTKKKAF